MSSVGVCEVHSRAVPKGFSLVLYLAVESSVQDGGGTGGKKGSVRQGGGLLLIPTFSRINRRVMYNAQDPIGHLDL